MIYVPGENDLYVEVFWQNWAIGAAVGSGPYNIATFYTTTKVDYSGHSEYVEDVATDSTTMSTSKNVYSDGAARVMLPYSTLGAASLYWILKPLMSSHTSEQFSWYKFIIRLTML
jgi:hypothetical protein